MNKEIEVVLNKTKAVISSAQQHNKRAVNRFIGLAIKRLIRLAATPEELWKVTAHSLDFYNLYENKFCRFIPTVDFNDD